MRTDEPDAIGYTRVARVLHWVTAVLVLLLLPLGIVIANQWGGKLQDLLYSAHKSIGALIIPLIVARLTYRLTHRPPSLPGDIPFVQRLAAQVTHLGALCAPNRPAAAWLDGHFGLSGRRCRFSVCSTCHRFSPPTARCRSNYCPCTGSSGSPLQP